MAVLIMTEKAKEIEKKQLTSADRVKLLQGALGIYFFFIQYGRIQERIFQFKSPTGQKFTQVWFLQIIDAIANVIVGLIGRQLQGITAGYPQNLLALSGSLQVVSKYCLSASLAAGLSFPVATLAKSAKMVPVMIGSLFLGGATFSQRQLSQAAAIVGGTSIVTLAEGGNKGKKSSGLGLLLILFALACDGVVGGVQKRLKNKLKEMKKKEKPYDLMFWSNFYMAVAALIMAVLKKELGPGAKYLRENPQIYSQILKFSVCGAMGQACIFYTISNFDPVLCTAVTTTRKLASVLVSIFETGKGISALPPMGWVGLSIAAAGITGEIL